jgi:glycosyltransferase involved in cell wall biosynthesis
MAGTGSGESGDRDGRGATPARAPGTVAIVLAVHNGEAYLAEALQSALAQTRPAEEIVVVDDGSTDRSAEIARSFPGVRVISQANAGQAAARNVGHAGTRSDYVVYLDHDDRLLPDTLSINAAHLDADPALGFVGGRSVVIDGQGRRRGSMTAKVDPPPCTYETMLRGIAFVPPSVMMLRRDAIDEAGGWRPDLRSGNTELDLLLRILRRRPALRHGEVLVEYRRHGSNASSDSVSRLRSAHDVLEDQRAFCAGDPRLLEALAEGKAHWAQVYGPGLVGKGVGHLRRGRVTRGLASLGAALRHYPQGFPLYLRQRFGRRRRV